MTKCAVKKFRSSTGVKAWNGGIKKWVWFVRCPEKSIQLPFGVNILFFLQHWITKCVAGFLFVTEQQNPCKLPPYCVSLWCWSQCPCRVSQGKLVPGNEPDPEEETLYMKSTALKSSTSPGIGRLLPGLGGAKLSGEHQTTCAGTAGPRSGCFQQRRTLTLTGDIFSEGEL